MEIAVVDSRDREGLNAVWSALLSVMESSWLSVCSRINPYLSGSDKRGSHEGGSLGDGHNGEDKRKELVHGCIYIDLEQNDFYWWWVCCCCYRSLRYSRFHERSLMCWWRGAVWCVRSFPSFSGYAARWWEPSPPRKTVSGLVHNGTSVVRFHPKYVSHDVCAFEGSFEGNPSDGTELVLFWFCWRARLNVLTWNTSLASSYSLWSKWISIVSTNLPPLDLRPFNS